MPGGGVTTKSPAVAVVANGEYMFAAIADDQRKVLINQGTPGGAFVGWYD